MQAISSSWTPKPMVRRWAMFSLSNIQHTKKPRKIGNAAFVFVEGATEDILVAANRSLTGVDYKTINCNRVLNQLLVAVLEASPKTPARAKLGRAHWRTPDLRAAPRTAAERLSAPDFGGDPSPSPST